MSARVQNLCLFSDMFRHPRLSQSTSDILNIPALSQRRKALRLMLTSVVCQFAPAVQSGGTFSGRVWAATEVRYILIRQHLGSEVEMKGQKSSRVTFTCFTSCKLPVRLSLRQSSYPCAPSSAQSLGTLWQDNKRTSQHHNPFSQLLQRQKTWPGGQGPARSSKKLWYDFSLVSTA